MANGWTNDYRPDNKTPTAGANQMLYPLYDIREQRKRFEAGEVTHKRLDQMNRRERRAHAVWKRRGEV